MNPTKIKIAKEAARVTSTAFIVLAITAVMSYVLSLLWFWLFPAPIVFLVLFIVQYNYTQRKAAYEEYLKKRMSNGKRLIRSGNYSDSLLSDAHPR